MKELIGTSILLVGIYGGTKALEQVYVAVRKAALEKSAKGLPPLPRFNQHAKQKE